jgi:cytochrome c553
VFATYAWNADGTDAVLAPSDGVRGSADIAAGRRHDIPSADACTACHGTDQPRPLGFTALQLSDDRDPNAIHGEPLEPGMVTLRSLANDGLLSPVPGPDAPAPRIRAASATTRSVLGYLLTNCGSCHNGRDEIAVRAPVFRDTDLMADGDAVARALIDRSTQWRAPGSYSGDSVLINSHQPDASAILLRMRSRRPSSQMPPLGTVVRDDAAVEALARWIETDLVPRTMAEARPR